MTEFTADRDGERLDVFLARMDETLSRSRVQRLIADGHVMVDGKTPKASQRLSEGATVAVEMPEPEATDILPEQIPLDILYEDEDVIVVNKARGMVVHPAAGVSRGTLVNALLAHCKDLSGINGALRPGIVHRLDKDTSGVMIAAKNDAAHRSLAEQIQEKTAKRVYWAILTGNIPEEEGVIHGAIGRNPKDRQKMAVVRENGKDATTKFRVLERFGAYTLVECRLMTGRTHQIRVHMKSIGHTLFNDERYGGQEILRGDRTSSYKAFIHNCFELCPRQALHARTLGFRHPSTGEELDFTSE